jgi:hypothetical protein
LAILDENEPTQRAPISRPTERSGVASQDPSQWTKLKLDGPVNKQLLQQLSGHLHTQPGSLEDGPDTEITISGQDVILDVKQECRHNQVRRKSVVQWNQSNAFLKANAARLIKQEAVNNAEAIRRATSRTQLNLGTPMEQVTEGNHHATGGSSGLSAVPPREVDAQ